MKKMMLKIASVILTLAAVLSLAGCFGEEKEPLPDIVLDDLYGTWIRETSRGEEKYSFSESMRYTKTVDGVFSRGTYSVSGSVLTITPEDVDKPSDHTVEIKGDTMIWGYSNIKAEYKRQK